MPLKLIPILDLAVEVADSLAGYKQKVHRIEPKLFIGEQRGAVRYQGLDVWLTAYQRNADGSYGERIPYDRIAERCVPLDALPLVAVELSGKVRFRPIAAGLVWDAVQQVQVKLADVLPETYLAFIQGQPDDLYWQPNVMAAKRDYDQECVRAFFEQQVQFADLEPSSFK